MIVKRSRNLNIVSDISHMNKCSVTKLKILTTFFLNIFTLLLINSLLS